MGSGLSHGSSVVTPSSEVSGTGHYKTGYWTDWTSGPIQYSNSYVVTLRDVLSFCLLPYGSCPGSVLVEMFVQSLYHKELDSLRMDTKCATMGHSVV